MSYMSSNAESPRRYFGDISQQTNMILDSGVTSLITPDILGFILISLVESDKHIEVPDGHFS